jgi:hypothetical protein
MRVIVYQQYGPPDFPRLSVVENPATKDNEMLVKIHSTKLVIPVVSHDEA